MKTLNREWFDFDSRKEWKSSGVNPARLLTHHSIAKWNSPESPYLLPNEWICARIAYFLGLPIPPFALSRKGPRGRRYFASLRFGNSAEAGPHDTQPDILYQKHSRICSGIILFDILIANPDRGFWNIDVDSPYEPKRLWIIDHERALCGIRPGYAEGRLTELWDRLGTSGGNITSQTRNCLLNHITSLEHFGEWRQRIQAIPEWFLRDTCGRVVNLGINKRTAKLIIRFLKHRQENLSSIVLDHKADFPQIKEWHLFI
jgi:hypothetical protein